jgi:hypothetical protein
MNLLRQLNTIATAVIVLSLLLIIGSLARLV